MDFSDREEMGQTGSDQPGSASRGRIPALPNTSQKISRLTKNQIAALQPHPLMNLRLEQFSVLSVLAK
jgi:hypothetical protein